MKNKMNKNGIRALVALAIALIVYNVIAFALPFGKNPVFWLSYAFTMIAMVAQAFLLNSGFAQGKSAKSKFYGFPIAQIGAVYLMAQLVIGLVFMATSKWIPTWLAAVVYVLLLGVSSIGFIAADVMRDEVIRQDEKLKKDVSVIRDLQSKANLMISQCESFEVKTAVQKFSENLRYSDPVGHQSLLESERNLAACMDELQQAIVDGDDECAITLCRRCEAALAERNRLCKLGKGNK